MPIKNHHFIYADSRVQTFMIDQDDILQAKILVVDDSEDNIGSMLKILDMVGYTQVSFLMDSNQVCAAHAKNDYALILLDMHMPGLNGLEVMRGLKEIEKDAYLPVLAITGDANFKIAALGGGARDFILKPYDILEVQKRIHNMLEVRLLYKAATKENRAQQKMALHDPLTELPNRRLLVDRIEKAMQHANRNSQSMALTYLDLDGFKIINDQYGHPFGDKLLKLVADRLLGLTREEDTVARIGGDEFIILLHGISEIEDVVRPVSHLLQFMAKPFELEGISIEISASIGVAVYPTDATDVDSLIASADKALYVAKRAGKNRYQFTAPSNPDG